MRVIDINVNNILVHEKPYVNILIYNISCKTIIDAKPLRIRFHEIDGFIKIDDWIRCLVLFDLARHNAFYDRVNYLISEKAILNIVLMIIMQESD